MTEAPIPVDRLVATFAVPEVGWMDTIFQAGELVFEFSLSDYDGGAKRSAKIEAALDAAGRTEG